MALACLFAAAAAAQAAPGALDVAITAGDASSYTLSLDGRTHQMHEYFAVYAEKRRVCGGRFRFIWPSG